MPTSIPVLVAAFAALAAASPFTAPPKPRLGFTFSANLTASKNEEDLNPALALAWPYAKYNVPMPPVVRAAALKQTAVIKAAAVSTSKKATSLTGSTVTVPEAFDVEYLVPISVNGLSMNLVLDSGSSDLWVYSDLMASSSQTGHSVYRTTRAKEQSGQSFYIKYGDGSHSEGKVYTDTVAIAGIQVTNYPVQAASVVSQSWLNHVDADGLLGLSMSSLNTVRPSQKQTFFDHIKSSLNKALFTITLKKGATGSLDFGYVDRAKFTGQLGYTDVWPANAQFWQFRIQRYAIAGRDFPKVSPFVTIMDSGTSLTYLPDAIIKDFYARIPGAAFDNAWAGWTFPCNSFVPWIGLYINGVKYSMSPATSNWARISSTHCLGGIQSSAALPFSILGATFMKRHYVIFDAQFAVPRIGIGLQNDAYVPSPASTTIEMSISSTSSSTTSSSITSSTESITTTTTLIISTTAASTSAFPTSTSWTPATTISATMSAYSSTFTTTSSNLGALTTPSESLLSPTDPPTSSAPSTTSDFGAATTSSWMTLATSASDSSSIDSGSSTTTSTSDASGITTTTSSEPATTSQ